MAEKEDISKLIDNEEIHEGTDMQLEADGNLEISADALEMPKVCGATNKAKDDWEFLKREWDSYLQKGDKSDISQEPEKSDTMKTEEKSETEKGIENLGIISAGDSAEVESSSKEKDSRDNFPNEMHPEQDRGSLDLMKYIINPTGTSTEKSQTETIDEASGIAHDNTIQTNGANPGNSEIPQSEGTGSVTVNSVMAVSYSNSKVEQGIVNEPRVIIRGMAADNEIQRHEEDTKEPRAQIAAVPFRRRKIILLRIFSVVAIFLFFPFGIPAAILANKIEGEFNKGILMGNIDKANKLIRKTEVLIAFSFTTAFIVVIIVFAVLEYYLLGKNDSYLKSKTMPGPHLG